MKTRKLTLLSMLCAIALTIFMVEAQIPPLTPIPGIKMGLANIITVFAVFAIGPKEAAAVLYRSMEYSSMEGEIRSLTVSA